MTRQFENKTTHQLEEVAQELKEYLETILDILNCGNEESSLINDAALAELKANAFAINQILNPEDYKQGE